MTKKETPAAAKAASASGTGAQGGQSQTGTSTQPKAASSSTDGQEVVLKGDLTNQTGTASSETAVATSTDALSADSLPSASAGDAVHPVASVTDVIDVDQAGEDDRGVPAIMVVARYEGFRRAGRTWSTRPTVVPLSELTVQQLLMLDADPNLRVRDTQITPDMDGDDK